MRIAISTKNFEVFSFLYKIPHIWSPENLISILNLVIEEKRTQLPEFLNFFETKAMFRNFNLA